VSEKTARAIRKAAQLQSRQLIFHAQEIKGYANALPFLARARIAVAILLGRW
jgi:hypothetical protein